MPKINYYNVHNLIFLQFFTNKILLLCPKINFLQIFSNII